MTVGGMGFIQERLLMMMMMICYIYIYTLYIYAIYMWRYLDDTGEGVGGAFGYCPGVPWG